MNLEKQPVVSVVMATYNRAQTLKQTIKNIFEQEYPSFELIVINDGSNDETFAVLKDLLADYDFTILNNSENIGLQKSLNKGIQKASGKYIARIDDHDFWIDSQKLSKQVSFLETHPEIGLVGTAYKSGNQIIQNPQTDKEIRNQILMRCPFCHVTVLIRKSVLETVGGYNEALPYSEDWDLWLKIGRHTKFANLSDVTTAIKTEETSLSNFYFLKQLPLNRQLVRQYFKDYPNSFKAWSYHHFVQLFFKIMPIDSLIHRGIKVVFQKAFLA